MKILLTLSLLVLSISLKAAGNGTSAGNFLRLPSGARSAALGEGGVALADGAESLALNPAAMVSVRRQAVQFTHAAYIDSSAFDQVTFVRRINKASHFGAGLHYFAPGQISETDVDGNAIGSLSPNDVALTGGYAHDLVFGSVGGTVKYVQSKLVHTASALTADIGFRTPLLYFERFRFAATLNNIVGSLKYDQESNPLPKHLRLGGGFGVTKAADATADITLPASGSSILSLGTEYRLKMAAPWGVALRGGYTTQTADINGFVGWTFGLGIKRGTFNVDYAFLPYGDIGSTHWITLGFRP